MTVLGHTARRAHAARARGHGHVVAGKPNKQIAADLGTGEQNIKLHRAHLRKKMGVESLADLVRAAEKLGIGR